MHTHTRTHAHTLARARAQVHFYRAPHASLNDIVNYRYAILRRRTADDSEINGDTTFPALDIGARVTRERSAHPPRA